MSEHDLVLTGPYQYFSTPEVFYDTCTCGSWSGDKDSERGIRKRHAQHVEDKEKNKTVDHSQDWDSNYERGLRNL